MIQDFKPSKVTKIDFTDPSNEMEQARELERHTSFNRETMITHFDNLSANFDTIMDKVGYPDPLKICTIVQNLASQSNQQIDKIKVCDFGCGTGRVGQQLHKIGVSDIVGLDCSEGMLHEASLKEIYSDLEWALLGEEEFVKTFPMQYRQKFDFVTAAGMLENNFENPEIFEQMLITLKNEGIAIFTVQYSYLGDFWWLPKLNDFEKLGRIKIIHQESFFKYENLSNVIGKFTKTPMKVIAFQKTEEDSVHVANLIRRGSFNVSNLSHDSI